MDVPAQPEPLGARIARMVVVVLGVLGAVGCGLAALAANHAGPGWDWKLVVGSALALQLLVLPLLLATAIGHSPFARRLRLAFAGVQLVSVVVVGLLLNGGQI